MSAAQVPFDAEYTLDDKYSRERGGVYITGVQALVRLPLMQHQRDLAAGLKTAGFISGYRGSPLGTYDLALWQAKRHLESHLVHFEPGVNEDLAATAVAGTQLLNNIEGPRYDGIFGIWYGKGPGVDRSCDALKHGNYAGTAPHGGVLALCGDDPGAKSSSIAHQSEQALVHMGMPMLNPSNVQDYLDLGLYGWAMSRYSGTWTGFKCLTDTVESAGSVEVGPERVQVVIPTDFELPTAARAGNPVVSEDALYRHRLPAVQAFVRANGLDRVAIDSGSRRRLGIVTTGKAYLDVRQALDAMGLSEAQCAELGLSLYKVALVWPLEPENLRRFASGLDHLLVVEEKRSFIEEQLVATLYNLSERPVVEGKRTRDGAPLVPQTGELSPAAVEAAIRQWIGRAAPDAVSRLRPLAELAASGGSANALTRMPSFCSGCPHSTSTRVPEGSVAGGGIGCHGMSSWMPSRKTVLFTHMGGEGANWVGIAPFTDTPHIFQNMGDGTYFHSGLLAIRANVAAGTNITYKVLANGAVAMTGGQPIEGESIDGAITTPQIVSQLASEGLVKIAVVSNEPDKYAKGSFPAGVEIYHRDQLDAVQRVMREITGVTGIVYDQTCAAEARRLRKRGEFPDPNRRIVINEAVCEGCGDCSVQSNCISIEPVETELGRKRRINQSSCNKDYSCLKGYCPSFVTVVGGQVKKAASETLDTGSDDLFRDLPMPEVASVKEPFNVLVTGIGGTGVITVGALLGMAAHLEGKGCSVLDVTGLAQKNGPVTSHVRIAERAEDLHANRIAAGGADLVIGCDIIVTTSPENLTKLAPHRTTPIVNSHVTPTSDFADDPDLDLSSAGMEDAIAARAGADAAHFVNGSGLAAALLGDAIFTNPFLMGFAFQKGRLPVGLGSLERAIELNGRAVEANKRAFLWGRLAAHDLEAVQQAAGVGIRESQRVAKTETLDDLVAHRMRFLTDYQNAAYAARYKALVDRVADRERALGVSGERLSMAVARYYAKVLAYKDEYEVARLFTDGSFQRQIESEFEGDYELIWNAAPPRLPVIDWWVDRRDARTGRTKKVEFGAWMFKVLGVMAKLKFLRGTAFDFFGRDAHRKLERQLITEYEETTREVLEGLTSENYDVAVQIASIPEHVRGFDTVKEEQLAAARGKQTELFDAFRRNASS